MLSVSLFTAGLYLVAGWLAWRERISPLLQRIVVPAALLLHASVLSHQTLHDGALSFGLGEAASLLALLSALMLWIVCLREPLQSLGTVHYPFSALCVLWPAFAANEGRDIPLSDWTIALHIFFSLLSAGMMTLAAIHALGLAILDRILHRPNNLSLARRLPPLQTMERLLFQLIFTGFFILSLTLLSGLLLNDEQRSQPIPMIVLSFGSWFMFGVLIFGRLRYGWRGRIAIRWALSGYATLVVAYFGSKLLFEQLNSPHLS